MATTIQSWSDPRLYGATFVIPLERSCQWIKKVSSSTYREHNFVVEIAFRTMQLAIGILAILITAPQALVGRLIQIIHFYTISIYDRFTSHKVHSAYDQVISFNSTSTYDFAKPAKAIDLQLPPAAKTLQEEFFRQDIPLTLALRFLSLKDLARAAGTNRTFAKDAIKAVKQELRQKEILSWEELVQCARLIDRSKYFLFTGISSHLTNLTTLDFSSCDFYNLSYSPSAYLFSMGKVKLGNITSLKFNSVTNLSDYSLEGILSDYSNKIRFPSLTYLDFTGSNFNPSPLLLYAACPFLKNGKGTFIQPDGTKYVGQWLEGKMSGQGVIIYPDQSKYEGKWLNGLRHGYGKFTDAVGATYEGQWEAGKRSGEGTRTYFKSEAAQGGQIKTYIGKYVGGWLAGKRSGDGTYTRADGALFVGEWLEGKMNGEGTYTHPDGTKYKGDWEAGEWSGLGVCNYPIGANPHGIKYVGGWREGKVIGRGQWTKADGAVFFGELINGEESGHWVCTFPDRTKYEGNLRKGIRHGQGKLTALDGTVHEGQWLNGLKHGGGVCTYPPGVNPNGIKCEGVWHYDKAVGPVLWTRADGTKSLV